MQKLSRLNHVILKSIVKLIKQNCLIKLLQAKLRKIIASPRIYLTPQENRFAVSFFRKSDDRRREGCAKN